MITTASQAFMAKVNNGETPSIRMQFVPASGTAFWLDDGDFWADSISFSEATSQSGEFSVGAAVIGSFGFTLNNFSGRFSDEVFPGAMVIPLLYYTINGEPEYLPKGAFYIASHKTMGNLIRCTAYDGMKLLDEHQTDITYPATVQAIVQNICTANAITLATATIPNGTYQVSKPDETLTDRQMLSYLCQITGNFAKIDENGHLTVGWYDFANPVTISHTFDGKDLWTDPVTITGIKGYAPSADEGATEEDTYTYGSDDCLLVIEDNPYMTASNLEAICTMIGQRICGQAFRPGSLPILANPCIQAGDVLQITDNITHAVYLLPATQITYTKSLTENVSCDFADDAEADLRPTSASRTRISIEQAKSEAASAASLATAASASATQAAAAALVADQKADAASAAATSAQASASAAASAAATADSKAVAATNAASAAQTSADNALSSATTANTAANSALTQLGIVEDVVNVLNWISEHGTYKISTDTEVVPGKYYFTYSGGSYNVVTNPTGNPSSQGYYELDSVDEAVSNFISAHLVLDNNGLWVIKDGQGYKTLLSNTGMIVYDTTGTAVASFGSSVVVGRAGTESYIEILPQEISGKDKDQNPYFVVGDLKGATATQQFTGNGSSRSYSIFYPAERPTVTIDGVSTDDFTYIENYLTFTTAPAQGARIIITYPYGTFTWYATFGERSPNLKIGPRSFAVGHNVVASGLLSHAEGQDTTASGEGSHAEGQTTTASGTYAHAEGVMSYATGEISHSEGYWNTASGKESHAEGYETTASGTDAHSEGRETTASGAASHAEGYETTASSAYSHAQNRGTVAASANQTAMGKFNEADSSNTYALIIGNGARDNARSNAFTVDWDGNAQMALDGTASSGTIDGDLYAAITALGWGSEVID